MIVYICIIVYTTIYIFYSVTVWYAWYKYETYNNWGFRQTDGETDIIIRLHLLMEEQKAAFSKFFLASSNNICVASLFINVNTREERFWCCWTYWIHFLCEHVQLSCTQSTVCTCSRIQCTRLQVHTQLYTHSWLCTQSTVCVHNWVCTKVCTQLILCRWQVLPKQGLVN